MGILVGRGTSPVTFDTEKFQKRLAAIAQEYGQQKEIENKEKVKLQFYKVLDKPVGEEEPVKAKQKQKQKTTVSEIVPEKVVPNLDKIPVKKSKKGETFKKSLKSAKSESTAKPAVKKAPAAKSEVKKAESKPTKEKQAGSKAMAVKKSASGIYTIQIAAYKDFKDAVTQMAELEKKGFASYRIKALKDGQTWYRVRVGNFESKAVADQYLKKLQKAKINGMVIKRKSNENIKG